MNFYFTVGVLYLTLLALSNAGRIGEVCQFKGKDYRLGDTITPHGQCMKYTCSPHGFEAIGCPQYKLQAGWTLSPYNYTNDWPECCPQPTPPASTSSPDAVCELEGNHFSTGDRYYPSERCMEYICTSTGIEGLGCPALQVQDGWTISPYNYTLDYPECCPQPIPPNSTTTTTVPPTTAPTPPDAVCEFNGVYYYDGETFHPDGECMEYTCTTDAITALGCSAFQVQDGWTISPYDFTLDYPECCPQPIPPNSTTVPPTTTPNPPVGICEFNGVYYYYGETFHPDGECMEYTCTAEGITASGCPNVEVEDGWTTFPYDYSQEYPACCPQAIPPEY